MVSAGCASAIICAPAVIIIAALAVLILNKKHN